MGTEGISPLLALPGAVAGDGVDAPVAAHYGSFNTEQRTLSAGDGFVDLSHRGVFTVTGPDRLTFLHSLTSQYFDGLPAGQPIQALVLSPQGHVEHHFHGVDDGETFTGHTEPGRVEELVGFLDRMRFMMRVEVVDVTAEKAVAWRAVGFEARVGFEAQASPSHLNHREGASHLNHREGASHLNQRGDLNQRGGFGRYDVVPRGQLAAYAEVAGPACGLWAYDALRIARGEPRLGFDTDHRTIPNEVGWIGSAVHLDKGCYRGQETVARVHTLGRPPRRLTLLHLDGSENRLPALHAPLTLDGKEVGVVGSSARHFELGPIALGLVKRNVAVDATLEADGLPATQEIVVDPEVGLHVRPRLG